MRTPTALQVRQSASALPGRSRSIHADEEAGDRQDSRMRPLPIIVGVAIGLLLAALGAVLVAAPLALTVIPAVWLVPCDSFRHHIIDGEFDRAPGIRRHFRDRSPTTQRPLCRQRRPSGR